jgi:hypothetical protein
MRFSLPLLLYLGSIGFGHWGQDVQSQTKNHSRLE